METIASIVAVILIAVNLPLLVAVCMGIRLHTNSTCEEDIKSARHNRMMIRAIAVTDLLCGFALIIAQI